MRWLCLDASAIDDVDFSAAETLRSVHAMLKAKGIRLIVAEVMQDLKRKTRYQLTELFGADAFYDHLEDVVKEYRRQFNIAAPSKSSDATPAGGVEPAPK